MNFIKKSIAWLTAAVLASTPCLAFADANYDAGSMTKAVAGVAYSYGNQINVTLTFEGASEGETSQRGKSAISLLDKSQVDLSFYDDYGTGRVHGVFSCDGVDLFEATVLFPADGSVQITTSLTGNTVMTLPAGTLGKNFNFQDFFYGSIMRRETDVSDENMTTLERLKATTSDMLVLVFNHLLGWVSYTQMARDNEFYMFDETGIDETDTRDAVCQRMIGQVYASEFCELFWNIASTADAEEGPFQQALADELAELGVTGLQVQQFADTLLPDITIDPAKDFVTPTHALKENKLCTMRNVSYFFKRLVKYLDKMWENCTSNMLSLIVSYNDQGRMVGFDAVLPIFTEILPNEGSLNWSLKTDEYGQETQTVHGEFQLTEDYRLVGDAVIIGGRDVGGVCESGVTASLDLKQTQGGAESVGFGIEGDMIAVLGTADDGSEQETLTGSGSISWRQNGEGTEVLNAGLDGKTVTPDGTSFTSDVGLKVVAIQVGSVTMSADISTGDPEEMTIGGGESMDLTHVTDEDINSLKETVTSSAMGLAPKLLFHPGVLSDLTGLVSQ